MLVRLDLKTSVGIVSENSYVQELHGIFEPLVAGDPARKQVGAIVAAASIIDLLSNEKQPKRMTAIARRLGIAPSSCFNILRTLAREDIIGFDPKSKTYSIDLGLVSIARNYFTPGGSLRVVGPLLEKFARAHELTVVIWRRAGHHLTVVAYFDHRAPVRVHIELGARFPILSGAMGRIMAARGGFSNRELKQLFARVKWDTSIGFDDFITESEIAKQKGWAFDPGTFNPGISTISTAIEEGQESIDAVLSATMFAGQHDRKTVEVIAVELCALARLLASVRVSRTF